MEMFKKCLKIAVLAHKWQKRKDGRPYITHRIRVSKSFSDERLKCIAILHDVLEDADSEYILPIIPSEILKPLKLLTKNEWITYENYIFALIGSWDRDAIEVKIADIMDNLSDNPSDKQIEKYSWALEQLL